MQFRAILQGLFTDIKQFLLLHLYTLILDRPDPMTIVPMTTAEDAIVTAMVATEEDVLALALTKIAMIDIEEEDAILVVEDATITEEDAMVAIRKDMEE